MQINQPPASLSNANPEDVGTTAAAGDDLLASRADHVHNLPASALNTRAVTQAVGAIRANGTLAGTTEEELASETIPVSTFGVGDILEVLAAVEIRDDTQSIAKIRLSDGTNTIDVTSSLTAAGSYHHAFNFSVYVTNDGATTVRVGGSYVNDTNASATKILSQNTFVLTAALTISVRGDGSAAGSVWRANTKILKHTGG